MKKVFDLFSGIGGFSLGLERTGGFKTVGFCESEEYPRKMLKKHWPDVPIFEDVRKLHAANFPETVDLICGGFPCQPYSFAGKRRGKEDDRHLWPEMFRLIQEAKPSWVIGENVIGFKNLGLEGCLDDLESAGYQTQVFDIPAYACDLQTLERHLWIISASDGLRFKRGKSCKNQNFRDAWKFQGADQGEKDRWNLPASRICGVGERVPNRMDRLKALGNAVPPQIPEILGRMILTTLGVCP